MVHELSKKETAGSFEVIDSTQISTVATPHEKSRVASAKNSKSPPTTTETQNNNENAPTKPVDEKPADDDVIDGEKGGQENRQEDDSPKQDELETYETSSDRANLGTEILTFLETGEKIPLNLIISVLKEALHRVPKTSGWILENFPTHFEQFEMFESEIVDLQAILHLDISDEEMILMNSKKENPNPKIETDLIEFNENWSKVTEQCSKIHKIENAEDQVTLDKIEDEILEIVRLESKPEEPEPEPEPEPVKEPEPEPEPVEERPPSGRGRSADKKGGKGKKGSKSRPGSGKSKGSRGGSAKSGKSADRPGSGASAKSSSSKGSKKSRSGSAKGKKKGKKVTEPEEPEIKPGDEKWEWVLVSKDENVPADFYHRLHQGLFYNKLN